MNKDTNNKINSKQVICPKCQENIRILFKDYKITLYECKNNHTINNILLNEFNNTQIIDLSKIICNNCKNIKSLSNSIKFYKCNTCGINLCNSCKSNHSQNHIIINYDKKNYKCDIHNEIYSSYCNKCKKNLCFLCENEHQSHDIIYYKDIIQQQENIKDEMNELNIKIGSFKNEIKEIISILNQVVDNFDLYYKIVYGIYNNYEVKNRNYQILRNILQIKDSNLNIINDINSIISEKNVISRFTKILNMHNLMNNKEIINNKEKANIQIDLKEKEKNINNEKKIQIYDVNINPIEKKENINVSDIISKENNIKKTENNKIIEERMKKASNLKDIEGNNKNEEIIDGQKNLKKGEININKEVRPKFLNNNFNRIKNQTKDKNEKPFVISDYEIRNQHIDYDTIEPYEDENDDEDFEEDEKIALELMDGVIKKLEEDSEESEEEKSQENEITEESDDEDDEITIKYIINENLKKIKLFDRKFVSQNCSKSYIVYNGKKHKLKEKIKVDNYKKGDILIVKLKNVSKIKDMGFMFNDCTSLISLPDISKIDTSQIINMKNLFSGCTSLTNFSGISKWDTKNVVSMNGMFSGCTSLTTLPDISKWNLNKVTNLNNIFEGCSKLLFLPNISKWNTKNVTSMAFMFHKCSNLSSLPDISKWDTKNVKTMRNTAREDLMSLHLSAFLYRYIRYSEFYRSVYQMSSDITLLKSFVYGLYGFILTIYRNPRKNN